jgi:glycosyltransferase involved in cell wall biosynthesis
MQHNNEIVTLSIVVPVYSGEKYLADLVAEIAGLKSRWESAGVDLLITEAIFVLDAPVDGSAECLANLAQIHPWIRRVDLSRNFGQHSATVAGILYSSGDWVITLDEDLQHRPMAIQMLLQQACTEKADVVYAQPKEWVHGRSYRDLLSRLVKMLIAALSGNRFVPSFNSFRLIRGDVARAASGICAQSTYFDVALTWFTQRIATVSMGLSDERYKQQKGSGYRLATLVQHAKRLILTSDFRILRFTTFLSVLTFILCILYGAWVFYQRFLSSHAIAVEGWTSLMIVMLAFGSVTVFMLGLIVEFLHMSMLQLQGKPTFFVINRASDARLAQEVLKLEASCKS